MPTLSSRDTRATRVLPRHSEMRCLASVLEDAACNGADSVTCLPPSTNCRTTVFPWAQSNYRGRRSVPVGRRVGFQTP